ncbi:MAG: Asp-tRNA(Asn)/Glu-tRNA(Gln) amidotransferase subunit GatB [Proteobacteria bacterium]|nr:Asp-tRNA(Asn)/Glu-tRNA(Gln) amidotransferase subunit GatB [Pseudomonadota bacterium]
MSFEAVIGLEVHAQLLTKSKIFCGCSTQFGSSPNSQTCPVCLGMPGVLPVLNKKVVEYAIMLGLATNCTINRNSYFARKNYFYPDLPKGYQISQYELPICSDGYIMIKTKEGEKRIGITRIHMEEDAGKLIHEGAHSLVDLNRTGTPLLEIVSEPDMRTPEEAVSYLKELRQILLYLGICDGNMEEGSFRCDANVSVRRKGDTKFGTKTELKNINSFRFIQKALEYEIERQIDIIESGGKIIQETRLFDSSKGITISMRSKEEAHDYRYFPEPDLMPIFVDEVHIKKIKESLPELPYEKRQRFKDQYNIPEYDIEILTNERDISDFFEKCVSLYNNPKTLSNFFMTEIMKELNERKCGILETKLTPGNVVEIFKLLDEDKINYNGAKTILPKIIETGKSPSVLIEEMGLVQISDTSALESIVMDVLRNNKKELKEYLSGKDKLFAFFVGQVMKRTSGKANPKILQDLLKEKLSKISIDEVDNL